MLVKEIVVGKVELKVIGENEGFHIELPPIIQFNQADDLKEALRQAHELLLDIACNSSCDCI